MQKRPHRYKRILCPHKSISSKSIYLTWNLNTKHIVKNGNMRLKILHSAAKFTSNMKDLKIIYNQYVRSKLDYGCNV